MTDLISSLVDWLFAPMNAMRGHDVSGWLSWHGRLMALAWGGLAPLAVFVARFLKILPGQNWPSRVDNPTWWRIHLHGQSAVFGLTVTGLVCILVVSAGMPEASVHRFVGYGVVFLAMLQVVSGLLRGSKGGPTDATMAGDHYDMTRRRLVFEAVHKGVGYLTIMVAGLCVLLGLRAANAPNWMWLSLVVWWVLLGVTAMFIQTRFGAYDTYQALWGPDRKHPGNQMRKQGWGTVRPGDLSGAWQERSGAAGPHSCTGRENDRD